VVASCKSLCIPRFALREVEKGSGLQGLYLNHSRAPRTRSTRPHSRLSWILGIVDHLGRQCRLEPRDFAFELGPDPKDLERPSLPYDLLLQSRTLKRETTVHGKTIVTMLQCSSCDAHWRRIDR
jgi:hypothetical protein